MLAGYARSQVLNSLTLDLISAQGLAPFSRILTARLAELFGSKASMLALLHGGQARIVHLHTDNLTISGRALRVILGKGLGQLCRQQIQERVEVPAAQVLGEGLADELGWQKFLVARLAGHDGIPVGLICLVDAKANSSESTELLRYLNTYVAVALEN